MIEHRETMQLWAPTKADLEDRIKYEFVIHHRLPLSFKRIHNMRPTDTGWKCEIDISKEAD